MVIVAIGLAAACARGPQPPDVAALGDLDPAVQTLLAEQVAAVRERPHDPDLWGRLGMAFEANGLTPQARDAYLAATAGDNSHGRWWYRRALLAQRDGDTDAALAALDRAIVLSPDYVPARWRRGLLLLDRGDLDGAEAAFRVASNLAPADPAGPTGLARVLLARERHQEAATRLEALLADAPGDRYAYQLLGTAYRRLGRDAEAQEALAAGAGGEPAWVDPWSDEMGSLRRGFAAELKDATALATVGRYPEAIARLERLRAQRPDDRALQTYLGGVYASAGRVADARALLDRTLAAAPDDFDATMHLATAHLFASEYDAAEQAAVRALALRPGSTDATRLRGVVAWRAGRLDEARRLLEAAAAADPRDAKALAWVGMIARERGRPAEALDGFRRALARDPLLVDALAGGAAAALDAGAREDADRWLARARRLAPGDARVGELARRAAGSGRS
jgi:tetratricopeptide (TPR) repeat protein